MEKKQTAVDVLKQHIQDAIEKAFVDNHYESGYKQCLIDIQNKIDDGLLQMEKGQIIDGWLNGMRGEMIAPLSIDNYKPEAEEYFNETYGGTK